MEDSFLEAAISEARQEVRQGGIPIASVIVHGGKTAGTKVHPRIQRGVAISHGKKQKPTRLLRQERIRAHLPHMDR